MSDFSDTIQHSPAHLPCERLEYKMRGRRGKKNMFGIDEDADGANQPSCNATLVHEMKIE